MTVPMEYRRASAWFDAFLREVADEMGLVTTNQSFTAVDGVLRAFRRRLTVEQGVMFAQELPVALRALFVADWDAGASPSTDWDRTVMTKEVQELRRNHNLAPYGAIADLAAVLRRHLDQTGFEACLDKLPPQARTFWSARP